MHHDQTITIERTKNVELVDDIYHSDDIAVKQELYAGHSMDSFKPCFEQSRFIFLLAKVNGQPAGFFLFEQQNADVYSVHDAFLKSYRGRPALGAAVQAIDWVFTRTPCILLTGVCPVAIPEARTFAFACGFHADYSRLNDHCVVSYHIWEWLRKKIKLTDYEHLGRHFAEDWLKPQLMSIDVRHDHPAWQMAGLVMHMGLECKQLDKAVSLFNLWAAGAHYHSIRLLVNVPAMLLIECNGETIDVKKGEFRCQLQL